MITYLPNSICLYIQRFRRTVLVLIGVGVALLAVSLPAYAFQVSGFSVDLGCKGYTFTSGLYTYTRDNTGVKHEETEVNVRDGTGTLLFSITLTYSDFTINAPLPAGSYVYQTLPKFNPIVYEWFSAAGNGFTRQVIHHAVGKCAGLPVHGPSAKAQEPPPPAYCDDGRINWTACAAPVAIYGRTALDVYAIQPQTSRGYLVLQVTAEHIKAVGIPTGENVTLAEGTNPFSGKSIIVSRLTSGEFQVNTSYADNKPYIVVWSADDPLKMYHIAW